MQYTHWADRAAALYKAGSSPSQVARDLGLKQPNSVSQVLREEIASYNIASHVSAITGIPLSQLFPSGRYNKPPKENMRRAADLPTKGRAVA
jgi:lambda repressor-like predicted transcriptional regulator